MKNITMEMEGKTLVIKIDTSKKFGTSASGKSEIVASTEGNISVEGTKDLKIGINCYVPVK